MLKNYAEGQEWKAEAECAGESLDTFFGPDPDPPKPGAKRSRAPAMKPAQRERAIAICNMCLVQEQCLEYAIETGQDHGIWGGKSKTERETIRRNREKKGRKRG